MNTSQAAGAHTHRWARWKVTKLRAQALRAVWRGDPEDFARQMRRAGEVQDAAKRREGYCKWRRAGSR